LASPFASPFFLDTPNLPSFAHSSNLSSKEGSPDKKVDTGLRKMKKKNPQHFC
jgi:hypothetical protein